MVPKRVHRLRGVFCEFVLSGLCAIALQCSLASGGEVDWVVLRFSEVPSPAAYDSFDRYLLNTSPVSLALPPSAGPAPCLPQPAPWTTPEQPSPPSPVENATTPPAPVEPESPSPAAPPELSPAEPNFIDFGAGLESQTMLASRNVPAMVGDFFERLKAAENYSAVPADRVYFNYSYFDNTLLIPGGLHTMRATFGWEQTFLDGLLSVEARVPFLRSMDNVVFLNASNGIDPALTDTTEWNLSNIQLYLKALLWESQSTAIAGGLGIGLPTAPSRDFVLPFSSGTARLSNDAVHLLPFLSIVHTPGDRIFATTLLQFDFDANGNRYSQPGGGSLPPSTGWFNDQQYLFLSQSLGYWVYQGNRFRFAPLAELHWNQTLNDADRVASNTDTIAVVNASLGATALLDNRFSISTAYVLPVAAGGADEQFDGEFRLLINWYYGN